MQRKSRYYEGFCQECREFRKLLFQDKDEQLGIIRMRCDNCFFLNAFPVKRVLETGRVLTESEFKKREEALSKVTDYSPKKTYWLGQTIRHPALNDVGKVVAKEETADQHKLITVDFENNGTKKLVEEYEASE